MTTSMRHHKHGELSPRDIILLMAGNFKNSTFNKDIRKLGILVITLGVLIILSLVYLFEILNKYINFDGLLKLLTP